MKRLIAALAVGLWSHTALGHSVGIFADPLGTECNLVIPYPGGAVTAYVVGTIEGPAAYGVVLVYFRIGGLPEGWAASVSGLGPDINVWVGNPFAEGIILSYPTCVTGTRVLLRLSIAASSAVENVKLVILPHLDFSYLDCGWEGRGCPEPCPHVCTCQGGGVGLDCFCVEPIPATINGAPCVVGIEHPTWGRVKATYKDATR